MAIATPAPTEVSTVSLTIDGREVSAPEGTFPEARAAIETIVAGGGSDHDLLDRLAHHQLEDSEQRYRHGCQRFHLYAGLSPRGDFRFQIDPAVLQLGAHIDVCQR